MNMMEMVLALFAVVFFTATASMYQRRVMEQNDYMINATQYVQATQLCHTVLDEVDAKLFSKQLAFWSINSLYNNTTRTIDLQFPGDIYQLSISSVDCDSLGAPLATPIYHNIYLRVRVTASTFGLKVPVIMQRVYTKTYLNL